MQWFDKFNQCARALMQGAHLNEGMTESARRPFSAEQRGKLERFTEQAVSWFQSAENSIHDAPTRTAFAHRSAEFSRRVSEGDGWAVSEIGEALECLRTACQGLLAGRSELEMRCAIVAYAAQSPEHWVPSVSELSTDIKCSERQAERLVDWALTRGLLSDEGGTNNGGTHFLVTSDAVEWLETAVADLESDDRLKRSTRRSDWTLDLSFVIDATIRSVLTAKLAELAVAIAAELPMAAVVLSGAIAEGILFDALVARKSVAMASAKAPRQKSGAVKDIEHDGWTFHDYITVAADVGLLQPTTTKSVSDVLRDFRNMIHPKKQAQSGMRPGTPEMNACVAWLEALARDVKAAPP